MPKTTSASVVAELRRIADAIDAQKISEPFFFEIELKAHWCDSRAVAGKLLAAHGGCVGKLQTSGDTRWISSEHTAGSEMTIYPNRDLLRSRSVREEKVVEVIEYAETPADLIAEATGGAP